MKSEVFWVITQRRVVIIYHTTLRNTPEDHRLHQHSGGSVKSRAALCFVPFTRNAHKIFLVIVSFFLNQRS
jgi:hypothetical protein